ncbi:MAG: ATP synthase F1 subunit gamma [Verrucomicrobiota bacterium]
MPNTQDIRRRIKSVKSTSQITKAMELVAASKMKKAQDQALAGRPYADLLNKVLVNLKRETEEEMHPLLKERAGGREMFLVITTDKGLCGPLNTNLLRELTDKASEDAQYVTAGTKGSQALSRLKKDLVAEFSLSDPVEFLEVRPIAKLLTEQFLSGDVSTVRVAFTNFISTLSQEPMIETLLPIRSIDLGRDKDFVGMGNAEDLPPITGEGPGAGGYEFEPTPATVLDYILPRYIALQIYQMVLESRASEHSARMVAMKSATDNANELIKDLTLEYNKLRQAAITNELLEITTAMKALE